MTVININNISGIASVNAQSNSLELFDNTGASLLDLNANTATFPGSISVGGTVTYDDVTNIDSVGVITARSGLQVTSGNVAIGTDNPQDTLDVANAVPQIRLTDLSDGSYGQIRANGGNLILRADEGNTIADSVILAEIDGGEKLRITADGDVGIGTDNPDVYSLGGNHRYAAIQASAGYTVLNLVDSNNSGSYLQYGNSSVRRGSLHFNSDSDFIITSNASNSGTTLTERFRIHSDGVIQTFNHAECLAYKNSQTVTGGDGSTHELGVDTFYFNRGGYTITSENIVVPKTGMYRCNIRVESVISNSAYSIRAMRCRPRVNGSISGTYTDHWHSATPGPSSNTHWSFRDMYYLNMNANDQVDAHFQWYPYASRTQGVHLSISLFYIG